MVSQKTDDRPIEFLYKIYLVLWIVGRLYSNLLNGKPERFRKSSPDPFSPPDSIRPRKSINPEQIDSLEEDQTMIRMLSNMMETILSERHAEKEDP